MLAAAATGTGARPEATTGLVSRPVVPCGEQANLRRALLRLLIGRSVWHGRRRTAGGVSAGGRLGRAAHPAVAGGSAGTGVRPRSGLPRRGGCFRPTGDVWASRAEPSRAGPPAADAALPVPSSRRARYRTAARRGGGRTALRSARPAARICTDPHGAPAATLAGPVT